MSAIRFAAPLIVVAVLCSLVASTRRRVHRRHGKSRQRVQREPDWVAPAASASRIARDDGHHAGDAGAETPYYVYANVSDTGNPASGTQTVTADVSAVTAGQTSVPLAAGSFTVGATTYNRRSAALTADNSMTAGTGRTRSTSPTRRGTRAPRAGSGSTPPTRRRSAARRDRHGRRREHVDHCGVPAASAGDTLFAAVGRAPQPANIPAPAGWAPYAQQSEAGVQLFVFRKTATGTEPASYTFNSDSGSRWRPASSPTATSRRATSSPACPRRIRSPRTRPAR